MATLEEALELDSMSQVSAPMKSRSFNPRFQVLLGCAVSRASATLNLSNSICLR